MKGRLKVKGASVVYLAGTPFVTKALDDVSIEIEPGEIVGMIGSTGSGKSTLVQAMAALIPLDEGKIEYPEGYDEKRLFERIGLVFQQPEDQLFERSVGEDVAFGPRQLGLDETEVLERVGRALKAMGLSPGDYSERNPLELSGGEKRRVAIAGILSMEPDLLILDEPTAALDQAGRDLLLGAIANLHKSMGLSLLIVSHDMGLLAALADRIVVLHKGRKVASKAPEELFFDSETLDSTGLRPPVTVELLSKLKDLGVPVETRLMSPEETAKSLVAALLPSKRKGK